MKTQKLKCPTCKGKKTFTVRAVEISANGQKRLPPVVMDCYTCGATGKVTTEEMAAIKAEAKIWCRCKASSGSDYVPDTEAMKHHWVCNDCGKITQIG